MADLKLVLSPTIPNVLPLQTFRLMSLQAVRVRPWEAGNCFTMCFALSTISDSLNKTASLHFRYCCQKLNPCGTYNDWFKTNKCYLIFTIILQNSFFLLCPVIRKKNQIVFKNIQSDFFIPFTVTDKRIIFILQYYLLKR